MGHWNKICTSNIRWRLPGVPAVYVVYGDHKLLYIGSTENLAKRFIGHGVNYARYSNAVESPWGRFDDIQIKFRTCAQFGEWLMREARLIRRLRPAHNRRGVRRA